MRASNSSLLGSDIRIHSGDISRATLKLYLRPLELFFRRSAHRFFIISDNRFLPSGVSPPPFFLMGATRLEATVVLLVAESPSRAAMA
jgi:hypothetical protein